jgi:RNA polymerase sigma factor (sigma-70 family)
MEDRELLDEFVKSRSQSAFRDLVQRHLPVVYSAARRMVRDSHLAEEVAQSVFTTLAQKAESIQPPQVLGGWLYNTTRYLAMHAVRTEQRRREREQTAFAMQSLNLPADVPEIAEHLEPAMAELDAEDRDALVLRYLADRGLREVGVELGVSEEAARKRVNRALERLRLVLQHRGVVITSILLATALTSSAVTVPVGLAATITTTSLAPLAATATLTKATIITMKTKTVIATIVVAAALGGTGTYLAVHFKSKVLQPPSVAVNTSATPFDPANPHIIKFANSDFTHGNDDRFLDEIDPDTKRTPDSAPAGHVKSLVAPALAGAADYLKTVNNPNGSLNGARYVFHNVTQDSPFLGKRVRISGWVKTRDVQNWAGGILQIVNKQGHIFADDEMNANAIRGTTDWQRIEMVADVPVEPCLIYFGMNIYGTGEFWCDDFQLEVVPPNTPVTDDRIWHMWSPNPNDYSVITDAGTLHNGHSTLCITYTPTGAAPGGSWMWWGQDIRDPEKFAGHTVRMTVWTKTENVSVNLRPNLRPKGPNFRLLAQDRMAGTRIAGTTDWTQHIVTCKIPKDTQCLDTGFAFTGSGKVWIDMKSVRYEIAD